LSFGVAGKGRADGGDSLKWEEGVLLLKAAGRRRAAAALACKLIVKLGGNNKRKEVLGGLPRLSLQALLAAAFTMK